VPIARLGALLKLRENGPAREWPECLEIRYAEVPARKAVVDQALKRPGALFKQRRLHPLSRIIISIGLACGSVLIIKIIMEQRFAPTMQGGKIEPFDRPEGSTSEAVAAFAAYSVGFQRVVVANLLRNRSSTTCLAE
jgi:hypothetical protein